jgi:hypothetical protein
MQPCLVLCTVLVTVDGLRTSTAQRYDHYGQIVDWPFSPSWSISNQASMPLAA